MHFELICHFLVWLIITFAIVVLTSLISIRLIFAKKNSFHIAIAIIAIFASLASFVYVKNLHLQFLPFSPIFKEIVLLNTNLSINDNSKKPRNADLCKIALHNYLNIKEVYYKNFKNEFGVIYTLCSNNYLFLDKISQNKFTKYSEFYKIQIRNNSLIKFEINKGEYIVLSLEILTFLFFMIMISFLIAPACAYKYLINTIKPTSYAKNIFWHNFITLTIADGILNFLKMESKQPLHINVSHLNKKLDIKIPDIMPKDKVYLGESLIYSNDSIELTDIERKSHVHVLGNVGCGKTACFLQPLLFQDINKKDRPVILVDGKGETELLQFAKKCLIKTDGNLERLKIFDITLSDKDAISYNPFEGAKPQQVVEILINSMKFSKSGDSAFYATEARSMLRTVIETAFSIPIVKAKIDKNGVVNYLIDYLMEGSIEPKILYTNYAKFWFNVSIDEDDDNKEAITFEKKDGGNQKQLQMLKIYMNSLKTKDRNKYQGLISQLSEFCSDEMINLLNPNNKCIEIDKAITNNHIVYFKLDNTSRRSLSALIGRLVIADMTLRAAQQMNVAQKDRKFIPLIIDEFEIFATEEFATLLANSRAAGIGATIIHQNLSQLNNVDGDLTQKISSVIGTKIIFRQDCPDDVDYLVRYGGTHEVREETRVEESAMFGKKLTGAMSSRTSDKTNINFNTIKSLKIGQSIVIQKVPNQSINLIAMMAPGEIYSYIS